MKKIAFAVGLAAWMAAGVQAADEEKSPKTKSGALVPALKTPKDKVSYSIGRTIGRQLKGQASSIDPELLVAGIRDSFAGESLLSDEEIQQTLMQFQKEMQDQAISKGKAAGEKNKKEGEAFLAANSKKEGIKALPSGLQYKILKSGKGETPTKNSSVTVHYKGTLLDGTEFDSSYKRGEPASFPVTGVIPGWTEILQLMKVGDKWQVFIPSKLAYGERGAGEDIGPNSMLTFEIELLDVK